MWLKIQIKNLVIKIALKIILFNYFKCMKIINIFLWSFNQISCYSSLLDHHITFFDITKDLLFVPLILAKTIKIELYLRIITMLIILFLHLKH